MPVKTLINLATRRGKRHFAPEGKRIYAVGDIHGRLDLLEQLLETIAADDHDRGSAEMLLIFLGDLVDRGPDSCGVVERLLQLSRGGTPARFLMGNHEEVFLRSARGDAKATRFLTRIGGRETLLSYGIDDEQYRSLDYDELTQVIAAKVPREHLEFLESFEAWVEEGDYLFVHAGIRPDVPIQSQKPSDLRWIRDEFLNHRGSFGKMVIHGHTITDSVDLQSNRIGIDTGAFASGRLSAIGLEGSERWFLST